jgi:hypothetical protein
MMMKASTTQLPVGYEEAATLLDGVVFNKDFDQFLSREMQSLSMNERTQVQEEIHGVSNLCPEETPEMVDEALKNMQDHLDKMKHKPIYDQLSPFSYLHTKEWRLRFLRCDLFDCQKAAVRLVRFTDYMEKEYDIEVLERPLRLSDLQTKCGDKEKEIMDSFKSGHSQLFPFRDRSGRRIFVTCQNHALKYEASIRVCNQYSTLTVMTVFEPTSLTSHNCTQYKTYQYQFLVASSDIETQRKGVVFVLWARGDPPFPDKYEITSKYFPFYSQLLLSYSVFVGHVLTFPSRSFNPYELHATSLCIYPPVL